MMAIGAVNYVAVVAAAIATMVVGMLWYSKALFGDKWMKLSGINPKEMGKMKDKMMGSMIGGFVMALIFAFVLAHFVSGMALMGALTVGFLLWLGFMLPLAANMVLWEGKSTELLMIHAAHHLVGILVASAVIVLVG